MNIYRKMQLSTPFEYVYFRFNGIDYSFKARLFPPREVKELGRKCIVHRGGGFKHKGKIVGRIHEASNSTKPFLVMLEKDRKIIRALKIELIERRKKKLPKQAEI